MAMVMPTVANMPTAAMPTPYKPAKWVDAKIIAAMVTTGIATDCMPSAKPLISIVAAPVSPSLASFLTGAPPV